MKNKKIVIFMLVAVMVLSLCLTALVGCNKDVPKGYKAVSDEFALSEALVNPLYNTAEGNTLDNLKAGATLKVDTNYGGKENSYIIKFGANLAFNIKDDNVNKFSLQILDAKASNANILSISYSEKANIAEEGAGSDQIGEGDVYVALGSGTNAKYFKINGLGIKSVLRNQYIWVDQEVKDASGNAIKNESGEVVKEKVPVRPSIDKDAAEDIASDVLTAIDGFTGTLDMIAGLGKIYEAKDSSSILIRLDVAKILKEADDLLAQASDMLDPIMTQLGLDLKAADLAKVLPALVVDLEVKFDGIDTSAENKWEDATIAGINASLSAKKKDFQIKKTDGNPLIRINIAKDFKADVAFDFQFGDSVVIPAPPQATYKTINAINFTAKGELELKNEIKATFNLNGDKSIIIPAGTYDIKLGADIDPTQLIGIDFTNLKGASIDKIMGLIQDVLTKAVKHLHLEIVDKTDTTKKLLLDASTVNDELILNAEFSLIGGDFATLLNTLSIQDMSVAETLEAVNGLLGMLTADSETASGEDNSELMATIAGIVKNLSIVADAGKLSVDLKNQLIAENSKTDEATGEETKLDSTTLDAKLEASKDGLTIDAAMKNIYIDGNFANVTAKVVANAQGVSITAKTEDLILGGNEMALDFVLKLTEFKYGAV